MVISIAVVIAKVKQVEDECKMLQDALRYNLAMIIFGQLITCLECSIVYVFHGSILLASGDLLEISSQCLESPIESR